jgi:predicted metal-binding membrane protein
MLLKRERLIIYASLITLVVLAWIYLLSLSASMQAAGMGMEMSMPISMPWTRLDYELTFSMWAIMMVAMMIPSAAPMILTYNHISQQRGSGRSGLAATWFFILGYLAVWCGFSLAATLAEGILHGSALLTPQLSSNSPLLAGALLIAAGIYQFSPLKTACLSHCRTPLGFLLSSWREGPSGAVWMGIRHGAYCVGCCWLIMALLFVGGVMNLLWIAALAIFVLLEKIAPPWPWLTRLAGILALIGGVWMIAGGIA